MTSISNFHKDTEKIRLFVGIPIPETYKEPLKLFKARNNQYEDVRWIPFKNLHITLFFIGSVTTQEVNPIITSLSRISMHTNSFLLSFKSFEFAPTKKARMLWATFNDNQSFTELSNSIAKELAHLRKSDHPPLPHITLARSKSHLFSSYLQATKPLPFLPVKQLVLWQSITHATGAEYHPLASIDIG